MMDRGEATKDELWSRYGAPKKADTAVALRTLGVRDEVHPKDAYAMAYSSREAAEAFAAADLEVYGHPNLGMYETDEGVISVLDLRPALTRNGMKVHEPELPDE